MKKKSIIFSIFTVFAFLFVSCADGIKGSLNDGTSNISTTNTTNDSGNESSGNGSGESATVDEDDPFAGSTWVYDQSNAYVTLKTTIKFSTNGTVDYSMNSSGTVTSIYSGPYTVEKDFNDVSGQYGAMVGSQTFTIPNKNATTTTFMGHTFKKQ